MVEITNVMTFFVCTQLTINISIGRLLRKVSPTKLSVANWHCLHSDMLQENEG